MAHKTSRLKQLIATPPEQIGPFQVLEGHEVDGKKLLLEGGHWVLIRPSGTEPLVRVYCEATSQQALEQIKEAMNEWILEIYV